MGANNGASLAVDSISCMRKIVTLTTDLGSKDYYVAGIKGQLLGQLSDHSIVDVSHDIEPYDIVQAALFLGTVYDSFPAGTIHIALVHTYYSSTHRLIAFEHEGHYFIGPDNGLFSLIWKDFAAVKVYAIRRDAISDTRLAALVAHVASGLRHDLELVDLGQLVSDASQRMSIQPVIAADQIRATIIHVDRFGNAIINLKQDTFEELRAGRRVKLYFKHDDPIYRFSDDYSDVPAGEPLAMWNDADYLEIAVNMGNASKLYNLNKNETIQIYFLNA